jgi:ribosomal protein L7Ae-like RNA K-turn-binding protein
MSATLRQMQKRRIRLLILADDISENSRKKVCEMAEAQRLPTLKFLSKGSIGELFGREEIGIIGVTDENFAKSILKVSEHA